ncbi:MAG: sensor histidine kinase [Pirellulales bacterium]
MTITTRLAIFFQLALGVVLIGFSLTLYALAHWHVYAQADRHLKAALDQLVAATEIHPADVEWEPLERKITLGNAADPRQPRWTLRDEQGHLIDCSANVDGQRWPASRDGWLLLGCRLRAGRLVPLAIAPQAIELPTEANPRLPADRTALRTEFTITVGLDRAPLERELLLLALALTGVSLVVWLTAALWGRWLCRRALQPVRDMAATARSLQQLPDSNLVLNVPNTNDELAELGTAFNAVLETLRASVEQQRRFARDASHQLRTPLAVMQTAADVALRQQRDAEEYRRVLGVIQRRSQDLTAIVEALLVLARQGSSTPVPPLEAVDLNRLCQQHFDNWREGDRAEDLQLKLSPEPAVVRSHAVLVGQVLDNLLDNALKYSAPGDQVLVRVSQTGREAVISVSDQGPGMSSAELAQACEPFYRSRQARSSDISGAGLGLAIARRFAELTGCRLEADSQPGQGSEFRIVCALIESAEETKVPDDKSNCVGEPVAK